MEEKKEALIRAVKIAVTKYGIAGISTRNVGELAQVNDAYIYRFFRNKEDLLLQAYQYENGPIFQTLLRKINKAHGFALSLCEKGRICFDAVWKELLSDPDRLTFCEFYYHSLNFKRAEGYHNEQLSELVVRLSKYYPTEEACKYAVYSMFTILYDSAYSVVNGKEQDTAEYAERVFTLLCAVMKSLMDNEEMK